MEVIEKTFRRFPMQYAATLGLDGNPQIRPLEFKFRDGERFYFDTIEDYESYREMLVHPYIMIRGATCALGYAAIQLAKAVGCEVIGTTHRESKLQLLKDAGCDEWILDDGNHTLRGRK